MPEVVQDTAFHGRNLLDERFGRRTVVAYLGKNSRGKAIWECECDCGDVSPVLGNLLLSGGGLSCGCLQIDLARTNDGASGHPAYRCWVAMIQRCCNPNNEDFHHYGGRGIVVCQRWKDSFFAFAEDMGNRPSPEHKIERIDNDGNYTPENCRWATQLEQTNNKRTNHKITHDGQTRTIAEWSRIIGVGQKTICQRLLRGDSDSDSLRPIRQTKSGR